jgi:hypothetical protein
MPVYSGSNGYAKGSCSTTKRCVGGLNPAAFTAPAPGTLGNVGKGEFIGPGYWNWDMGFFKNIPIREAISMQFRGEFFNTFNRPTFLWIIRAPVRRVPFRLQPRRPPVRSRPPTIHGLFSSR